MMPWVISNATDCLTKIISRSVSVTDIPTDCIIAVLCCIIEYLFESHDGPIFLEWRIGYATSRSVVAFLATGLMPVGLQLSNVENLLALFVTPSVHTNMGKDIVLSPMC